MAQSKGNLVELNFRSTAIQANLAYAFDVAIYFNNQPRRIKYIKLLNIAQCGIR